MRVKCINAPQIEGIHLGKFPVIVVGQIYTVVDYIEDDGSDWYELAETGPDVVWECWNFTELDDSDELSEERKEKIWDRVMASLDL